jgi:L,D-peptidoglycan transpeptidase YkuD (ErfK/YbiS/YcfS/YnhG family)
MELRVLRKEDGSHRLRWEGGEAPCAIGQGGIRTDKREGDGATPVGSFALRRVLYRADRLTAPATGLPVVALAPDDGWCDAPADPAYNRPVRLPYAASHERMWRDDGLYDLVVVLGHNDDPPVPGAGSAIFLHVARPGFLPTEGCVAVERDVLRALLARCGPGDVLTVPGP